MCFLCSNNTYKVCEDPDGYCYWREALGCYLISELSQENGVLVIH